MAEAFKNEAVPAAFCEPKVFTNNIEAISEMMMEHLR